MGKGYKHVSRFERDEIYRLLKGGKSQEEIAKILGRSPSAISREINRNSDENLGYLPDTADKKARRRRQPTGGKINNNKQLRDYICDSLAMGWSPEQISGRMKQEKQPFYCCHETIYQFIYSPAAKENSLFQHLCKAKSRRGRKFARKARKTPIPNRISINKRPREVDKRKQIGHWEGDLVIYQKQNIISLVERKSRYSMIIKNQSKHKDSTMKNLKSKFGLLPEKLRKSVTFDNGGEFAAHEQLREIGCDTYFCDPYASWQKGAVENMNGRIRRFLPKSTNLDQYSDKDIDNIQWIINNTPRKILGYKTPREVLLKELALIKAA